MLWSVVKDDEVFLPAQEGGAGLLILEYPSFAFDSKVAFVTAELRDQEHQTLGDVGV